MEARGMLVAGNKHCADNSLSWKRSVCVGCELGLLMSWFAAPTCKAQLWGIRGGVSSEKLRLKHELFASLGVSCLPKRPPSTGLLPTKTKLTPSMHGRLGPRLCRIPPVQIQTLAHRILICRTSPQQSDAESPLVRGCASGGRPAKAHLPRAGPHRIGCSARSSSACFSRRRLTGAVSPEGRAQQLLRYVLRVVEPAGYHPRLLGVRAEGDGQSHDDSTERSRAMKPANGRRPSE